jgi:hypothetical protein
MDRDVGKKTEKYLRFHGYLRLATVDPEGKPLVRVDPVEGYFRDNTVTFGHRDMVTF